MDPRPKKLQLLRWLPHRLMLSTAPADGRALYLTFDDGPNADHTTRVLDLLAQHDARATFFVLGQQAERHPDLMRRIAAEGHALGNHSYDHPSFLRISPAEQMAQIERTDAIIAPFNGGRRPAFRPPSGRFPPSLLWRFLRARRRMAYWSYDSLDYRREPLERMLAVIRAKPPVPGDVVLMHYDSAQTSQALVILLPEWRAAGFVLRALPD